MTSLEKVGITLPLDDLKEVKTNKELAIENIETIIQYMKNKCSNKSAYNVSDQSKSWLMHYAEMIEKEVNKLK
mgnify:FL=1